MSTDSPIVYILVGAAGSGRREAVIDLIDGGLPTDEQTVVFLADSEVTDPLDEKLGDTVRWRYSEANAIEAAWPVVATVGFFITDGRRDPVDQIEALKPWIESQGIELARVICIYHCQLVEANKPLLTWYDACVHFSDIVLLNRREGIGNKWLSDLRIRFEKQFIPCLIEIVKKGRVHNPALVLDPLPRRLSHWFDEVEESWTDLVDDSGETLILEDGEEVEAEEVDDEDIYLARQTSGRRKRVIPDINDYLPGL
jgi:hypothetical protein